MKNKSKNLNKLSKRIMREIEFDKKTKQMSNKELADYLIEHFWSKCEYGTMHSSVLDRVIERLFDVEQEF